MTHDALSSAGPHLLQPSLKDNLAYSLEQAGAVTGLGRSALYLAVRDRKLVARKLGRRTVVRRADLEAFLDALPAREA